MTIRDWHKLTLIKWYFNHEIFRKRAERGKGWHVCIYIYIYVLYILSILNRCYTQLQVSLNSTMIPNFCQQFKRDRHMKQIHAEVHKPSEIHFSHCTIVSTKRDHLCNSLPWGQVEIGETAVNLILQILNKSINGYLAVYRPQLLKTCSKSYWQNWWSCSLCLLK